MRKGKKQNTFNMGRGQSLVYNKPVPKFLQKYVALPYEEPKAKEIPELEGDEDDVPEDIKAELEEATRKLEQEKADQEKREQERKQKEEEEKEAREGTHKFRKPTQKRKLEAAQTTPKGSEEPKRARAEKPKVESGSSKEARKPQIKKVSVPHNQNRGMLSFDEEESA